MTGNDTKALVLGGGGVAGIAWETGVLAGLANAGIDVTHPDLVVGTSAGAAVAAQITSSKSLTALYEDQINGTGATEPVIDDVDPVALMAEVREILSSGDEPQVIRQRIGAMSLAQDRVPESERRAIIEARLPDHTWPEPSLAITAIDAASGDFVVLTDGSGVDLVDAVAASCSIPRVWVTAPLFTIRPDEASEAGMKNLLDPNSRAICARAGYEQAHKIAGEVEAFWA